MDMQVTHKISIVEASAERTVWKCDMCGRHIEFWMDPYKTVAVYKGDQSVIHVARNEQLPLSVRVEVS